MVTAPLSVVIAWPVVYQDREDGVVVGEPEFARPEPPEDERALVEAARTDPEAFARLYRRYLPRVHAFALRRSQSRHVTEDVTAATFERAYRMLDRFEWRGGGFAPWLFRIAANELADHYRRQVRARSDRGQFAMARLHSAATVDDLERVEDGPRPVDSLLTALGRLPIRYQEAISLRYLAGLTHEEAAAAMGVSKPVMAVTLSRAVKALRRAMDDEGTGGSS
jgi:RNA polymerase sigma-70 factor, ECF subfamily